MKKILLPIFVLFCMGFVNALDKMDRTDCHAQACEQLADMEEEFEMSEEEAENTYAHFYGVCVRGGN